MNRDLTGLTEEQIEAVDDMIAELRKKSWKRHQIGSLHIDREGECGYSDENPCSGRVEFEFDVWEKCGPNQKVALIDQWIEQLSAARERALTIHTFISWAEE